MFKTIRRSASVFVLTALAATALLLWNAFTRFDDTVTFQQQLATRSVAGAAHEIELQIQELRNRVNLFVEQQAGLIAAVVQHGDNSSYFDDLEARIQRHFKTRLAFTVADSSGTKLVEGIESLVGQMCMTDIRKFASDDHPYEVFIHPQPGNYHFDIMVPWHADDGTTGVFFISFLPDLITRLLAATEVNGHSLFLLKDDLVGVIEVTDSGTRDTLDMAPQLSPEQQENVLASTRVNGTRWLLVDVPDADLFDTVAHSIARQTGFALVVLIGMMLFSFRYLRKSELQRFKAERQLRRTQHELALQVKDRTHQLSQARFELRSETDERMQIQHELKVRNAILRSILENAKRNIIGINCTGSVVAASNSAARLFGYRKESEMHRMTVSELFALDEDSRMFKEDSRELQSDQIEETVHERMVTGIGKKGNRFPVLVTVVVSRAGKNNIYTVFVQEVEVALAVSNDS